MQTNRLKFLRGFWALFKPYWFSEEKVTARLLLLSIVVLSLGMVYINVRVNEWHALFFNSLQAKDQNEFFHQAGRFAILAAIYIPLRIFAVSDADAADPLAALADRPLSGRVARTIRLLPHAAHRRAKRQPDPAYRGGLAYLRRGDDQLSIGLMNAIVTLLVFVGVLWVLSGPLSFTSPARTSRSLGIWSGSR
jgi:putative ATP-binding cassette transporter